MDNYSRSAAISKSKYVVLWVLTTLLKDFYRLHDLGHLVILYPNKQKDDVFGKYYAPPRKTC